MRIYKVVVDEYGHIAWFKPGTNERHREDGPAIEYANGDRLWLQNDELHRTDGPALEFINGTREWYLYGEELNEEEFNQRLERVRS
jgi:hypothetical protein